MGGRDEGAAAGSISPHPSPGLSPGTIRPVRTQLALYCPKLMKQPGTEQDQATADGGGAAVMVGSIPAAVPETCTCAHVRVLASDRVVEGMSLWQVGGQEPLKNTTLFFNVAETLLGDMELIAY